MVAYNLLVYAPAPEADASMQDRAMTPEGRVKAMVNRALKKYGANVWKFMPVQMGMGAPALDYLLCAYGCFISVETKVKGKKMTPRQEQTAKLIDEAGGFVFVVDGDETLQHLIEAIEFLKEQREQEELL